MSAPRKPRTPAQAERQATRKAGRYSTMNRCHLCGRGVGADYYSSSNHNDEHGLGLVLHAECCTKWETDPAKYTALARERGHWLR